MVCGVSETGSECPRPTARRGGEPGSPGGGTWRQLASRTAGGRQTKATAAAQTAAARSRDSGGGGAASRAARAAIWLSGAPRRRDGAAPRPALRGDGSRR